MEEMHKGLYGSHMNGIVLTRKVMRQGYYWLTMEKDCIALVRKCRECQLYSNLSHIPLTELHNLTSPWPFVAWRIDIIKEIKPLLNDNKVHFMGRKAYLLLEYKIEHHRSSLYKPQANEAMEATNKNLKKILLKMNLYFLVYGTEMVLLVELGLKSFKIVLEAKIQEYQWVEQRYPQLVLVDEKIMKGLFHM
ncbi:uncharacterized protein LOC107261405 [Ricinus communis]|uniref:uncharacterized protein LOC107261405 n=1 Tax=Ricinus communis TaxID=3988 RepID=UPI00077283D0|nr:uncharacterized protein LOC107261405 [Ricinus communis]|eukprot:XP_015575897.1 uncharacterized protein LOC107261405 [Ricinus communis]